MTCSFPQDCLFCLGFYAVSTVFQLCNGDSSQINVSWTIFIQYLKCNSSPDKHVFLHLFPNCLCIFIHFSADPTTIQARVLCLFTQVCKRKNPISKPCLDLAVILVTSRYEHNALPVNSER